MTISVQAIRDLGGDFDRVDNDADATEFGVYIYSEGRAHHVQSFPTRLEAEKKQADLIDCLAEQVAIFGTQINWGLCVTDSASVYRALVDQAAAFCAEYEPQVAREPDLWDAADWYETSDLWFSEHVAPDIYLEGQL